MNTEAFYSAKRIDQQVYNVLNGKYSEFCLLIDGEKLLISRVCDRKSARELTQTTTIFYAFT
jgi:hypothetical protein